MKRRWFCAVAAGLLVTTVTLAQQSANESPNTLTFENGTLANGIYSNGCFGFSFPIPTGWEVDSAVTAGGQARHRSDGSLVLLFLRQQGNLPGKIMLSARVAVGHSGGAQGFVSDLVRAQIKSTTEKRELVRDTFAVDYGGRHFFRSDYKVLMQDGIPLYLAYIYTEFRGYFIGGILGSSSPETLDETANSLRSISFQQDEINPRCTTGDAAASRVQLGEKLTKGLLIKRVPPDYPEQARWARIQGQVVLKAVIDKNGEIQDLTLVSGHHMLAPAAIQAVKQWKYKPYLLNGQATEVETVIVVNFTLSEF